MQSFSAANNVHPLMISYRVTTAETVLQEKVFTFFPLYLLPRVRVSMI